MTGRVLAYGHVLFILSLWLAAFLGVVFSRVGFTRWCFVCCALIPVVFLYSSIFSVLDGLLDGYSGYEYQGSAKFKVNPAANAVYILLFFLAGWAAFRLSRVKDSEQLIAVLALALVLLPVTGITGKVFSSAAAEQVASFARDRDFVTKPNVYLIAMDGYPRSDVMRDVFDYDNGSFIKGLEDYGFRIQKKAQANYPNTHLSLSSTLLSDYLRTDSNPLFSAKWHAVVTGDNPAVGYFKEQGYSYIHMEAGVYALTKCVGLEDVCFSSPQFSLSEHEYALLQQTPWAFLKTILPIDVYLTDAGANLGKLRNRLAAEKPAAPFFLFAHTVPPHAPYAYNRDCSIKEQFDHGYAEALFGQEEEFFEGYLDNIICTNKYALEFAKYVKKTDPSGIVVLFSDHGSHFTMDWKNATWSESQIRERYADFNAVRAPESCQKHLYDDMSNVNIMRFVFGCLTETAPDYLDDRQYFSSYVPHTPHYGEIVDLDVLREAAQSTVPDIVE